MSVRVEADYGSSGLWLTYPGGLFRGSGISCEALRLPPVLALRFADWLGAYYGVENRKGDLNAFNAAGRALARDLKDHLGPDSYVEFAPESSEGIAKAEVIE